MNSSNLLSASLNQVDSNAFIIFIVGYLVVFTALVLLYFVFHFLPKLITYFQERKLRQAGKAKPPIVEVELSGEVNAAISMALYLYFNQYHDEESRAMTIVRESRIYSPWSSKIYQVRNQFNRL